MSEMTFPVHPAPAPTSIRVAANSASRYLQALRTYKRPIPVAVSLLVLAASFLPVTCTTGLLQLSAAGGTCMIAALLAMFVLFHLRNQLDDPRSFLTPGFRLPHILAASTLIGPLSLFVPIALFLLTPFPFFDLFAYTVTLTAVLAWMCYDPLAVVAIVAFLMNVIPSNNLLVNGLPEASIRTTLFALLSTFVSSLALVALLLIYARLNGEGTAQSSVNQPLTLHLRPRSSGARANFPLGPVTSFAGRILLFLQARLDLLRTPSTIAPVANPASFLSAVRRRRRATFFGLSPALFALLLELITLALYFVGTWEADAPTRSVDGALLFFLFPATLFIAMSGAFWPRHWLYLPAESLFPATRNRFIRECAVAFALDFLSFWVTSSLAAIVFLVALFPHALSDDMAVAFACLLVTASTFCLSFGLFSWTMLFRNAIVSFIALFVALTAFVVSISEMSDVRLSAPLAQSLPPICAFLILVGGIFAARAYHVWLRIDLN